MTEKRSRPDDQSRAAKRLGEDSNTILTVAVPESTADARAFWYDLGTIDTELRLRAQIDRLEWEADLWYFVANNPGKKPTDYLRTATDRLWAEAEC